MRSQVDQEVSANMPQVNPAYLQAAGVVLPVETMAPARREIVGYTLKDKQTGKIIAHYGPDKGTVARRRRDRMDQEYGAYRYIVSAMYKEIV